MDFLEQRWADWWPPVYGDSMPSKNEAVPITSGEVVGEEYAGFLLLRLQMNSLSVIGHSPSLEKARELAVAYSDGKHVVYVVPVSYQYDPNAPV